MAAMELDPLFLKALTLLRSKSRDSADQLRALLDEVLGKKSKTEQSHRSDDDKSERRKELKEGGRIKKSVSLEDQRRNPIKRPLDKQASMPKTDSSKKLKLDITKRPSTIRKPVIDDNDEEQGESDEDDTVFEAEKTGPPEVINISSDSDDVAPGRGGARSGPATGEEEVGQTDMDDFALELGLACVVCKKMDVSAKNQLIECQECHSLYHQFCHKPAATDADANDPRLVWYCAKCQRNMRKSVDKKPMKSSSSMSDLSGMQKGSWETGMNLFKRSEPKTPPVSSVGKSQPFTGLANFAANVSGKSSSSAKSSSAPSKPSTIIGKSNIRVNMVATTSGPLKPGPIKPIPTKSSGGGANTVPSRPGPARLAKPGSVGPGVSRPGSTAGPVKSSGSLSSSRTIVSKFKSSATTGSRSPSPQPTSSVGSSKVKGGGGTKNLPQTSQASAMKRLQQMKKKASKR